MEFYKSTNLTRYSFNTIPSLNDIISFIDINDMDELTKSFNKEIEEDIISKDNYIDSTLHHLIITPYLIDSSYLEMLENKNLLKLFIENFDELLLNIWCNTTNDNFKEIDPKKILLSWSNLLYKVNSQSKLENKKTFFIDL